jgi:hypothetical protein
MLANASSKLLLAFIHTLFTSFFIIGIDVE